MAKGGRSKLPTPAICPVCGEEVPRGALACPECGADHRSGWREDAGDGLDLPNEEFDYENFVREEFGRSARPAGLAPIWWITGILLVAALAALYFYAGWSR